jgi:alpha-1,3/alpha-1,6-mannosyltransferase
LTYEIKAPEISQHTIPQLSPPTASTADPDILFLLNFTTPQRSALLTSPDTLALLYTPTNEHFGIGPVEGMVCGVPVLACNTGGPTESILDAPLEERTGWLCPPDADVWAGALEEIVEMSPADRALLSDRAKTRAKEFFGMDAMADGLEEALKEAYAMGPVPGLSTFAYMVLVTFAVLLAAVFVRWLV